MIVRQNLFFVIVGTNGVGKTTILNKMVNESGKKTLILEPDGMEWGGVPEINTEQIPKFSQVEKPYKARMISPEPEDLEEFIKYSNGNLVLDDCRYYLKARMEQEIRKVLIRRRQNNIDVFAVAHSLIDIPAQFWIFATHLILFKTTPIRLSNTREFSHLKPAIEEVNANSNPYHFKIIPLRDF